MGMERLAPVLIATIVVTGCAPPAWRWSHPTHTDQGRFNVDLMQCQQYAATTAPYTQRYGQYDLGTAILFGSRQAAYESGVAGCMSRLGYSFYRADSAPPRYTSPSSTSATATRPDDSCGPGRYWSGSAGGCVDKPKDCAATEYWSASVGKCMPRDPANDPPPTATPSVAKEPDSIVPARPQQPAQPAVAVATNLEAWVPGRWKSAGGTNVLTITPEFSWEWQSTFGGEWKGSGGGRLEGNKIILTGSFNGSSSAGQRAVSQPITITLTREGDVLAGELFTSRTWRMVFERQ